MERREKLRNTKFVGSKCPEGVLWALAIFEFFGYRQFLNSHNLGSTNDRLVLVSNIMIWDELPDNFGILENFCGPQKKKEKSNWGAILGTHKPQV